MKNKFATAFLMVLLVVLCAAAKPPARTGALPDSGSVSAANGQLPVGACGGAIRRGRRYKPCERVHRPPGPAA